MEESKIVIVGSGFAGVWAALGAVATVHDEQAEDQVRIVLVSPDGNLVIRPRLYEADLRGVRVPLDGILLPVGVEERRAAGTSIDPERQVLTLEESPGELRYDQLVLCAGSQLTVPGDPGAVHGADDYEQSLALHDAIEALSRDPERELSATVVGGGFTGLEIAAELADMLRAVAEETGRDDSVSRVRLVEQNAMVAPEFGPNAREVIAAALDKLAVETVVGVGVEKVDAHGVSLADGRRLDSGLAVWAVGPRASVLNEELGVELDSSGRVPVSRKMATGVPGIWAAGDSVRVTADGEHLALSSCQHAMPQGRQAGENAARAVLGLQPRDYHQPLYVTCLDLGSAGALLTHGFARDDVIASGEDGKVVKQFINQSAIYPPKGKTGLLALGSTAPPGDAAAADQAFEALRHAAVSRARTAPRTATAFHPRSDRELAGDRPKARPGRLD